MYCDRHGRPDANGDYELVNGTVCLRDGRSTSFSLMFMDGAARATVLTDSERSLATAKAMRDHLLRYAYLPNPPPFTAHDEAVAIDAAAKEKTARAAFVARMTADTKAAQAMRDAAYEARKMAIANGWKQ